MLVGRERERREIAAALGAARAGTSAVLLLVGEAGIGKTALLDDAAEQAGDLRVLRARGVESEAQIPFASLLELLRPALALVDRLPPPQAGALEAAFALRTAPAQERFAVGAATLGLLATYAEAGPIAVLVDDAHWLDASSAQALLFAVRRLVADPIAVLVAVREGVDSLLDGADLRTLRLSGLSDSEAAELLGASPPGVSMRLHRSTGGNPLGLLELASDPPDLTLAPEGAPMLVSARLARHAVTRAAALDDDARRALVLVATSDSGELSMLDRAARRLAIDLGALDAAERAGLVELTPGAVAFRHPLMRSAVYTAAPADERRAAHRALANSLPDRDFDRRAWHLAAAATGPDDAACAALEQAGERGQVRSSYATATAAFERASRLTSDAERCARLLWRAAQNAWLAGLADRAAGLLDTARASTADVETLLEIEQLAGHIATRRGPVLRGHAILTAAAVHADPERAIVMLADAAAACFYAGEAAEMLAVAREAQRRLTPGASMRARFLVTTTVGMAHTLGGDAAAGAEALHAATALAERSPAIREDVDLLPWLALAPIFLRETSAGRPLLEDAMRVARERAAVGALPSVLNLVARDQATTDRWATAEATYREALALARESGQRVELVFGLAGLASLQARRGREADCRACAAEALELGEAVGMGTQAVWATAALGELELGLGDAAAAVCHFERQREQLCRLAITDVDLSPAAELVDVYVRLGRIEEATQLADQLARDAAAKGQPWSLARAARCRALLADDDAHAEHFEQALRWHAETPDVFETARSHLAYGERLRRARRRVLAREQLRAALATFERLDARPWAERARAELAATGERSRRRDPSTADELTPQELQIAVMLAGGRTTRETATSLFLSPKTVEYHLRHVYQKLRIHSREELTAALTDVPEAG